MICQPTRSRIFALLLPILTLTGCQQNDKSELKLAYVMSPGGPAHEAAQKFAELVGTKTDGQLSVRLFPSAQLGNDRELVEGLGIGSVDLVLSGAAPIGWYIPQFGAVEAPFVFDSYDHLDRVLTGKVGQKMEAALLKAKNIQILSYWHRGPRYLTTTDRKVHTPDDLSGLKLRVPELKTYMEAWSILGANVTPITYSEMFLALKQGIVEGQENPLEVISTSSLNEVQKYVMETEHLLGFYLLMINDRRLTSLSTSLQTAVREAANEAGLIEHDLMLQYDQRYKQQLRDLGMEFVPVDREAFRKPVVKELPKRFASEWLDGLLQDLTENN